MTACGRSPTHRRCAAPSPPLGWASALPAPSAWAPPGPAQPGNPDPLGPWHARTPHRPCALPSLSWHLPGLPLLLIGSDTTGCPWGGAGRPWTGPQWGAQDSEPWGSGVGDKPTGGSVAARTPQPLPPEWQGRGWSWQADGGVVSTLRGVCVLGLQLQAL